MNSLYRFPRRLSTQLIILFVGLVIITAIAIGLPAIWLINRQVDTQFWERIEEGQSASQALLAAEGRDVDGLAKLTAQRPTLISLLLQNEFVTLPTYLETLRQGASLDFLVICSPTRTVIAASGIEADAEICDSTPSSQHIIKPIMNESSIIVLASSVIRSDAGDLGEIVVGRFIDDDFARALREQTGLEHIFLVGPQIAASSLEMHSPYDPVNTSPIGSTDPLLDQRFTAQVNGATYYIARQEVLDSGLINDVALSTQALTLTRRRLEWGWLAGMAIVMALGSIVGLLLSRRIGGTFDKLAAAAIAFQNGDLESPVRIDTYLDEAVSVAKALENARLELNESLLQLRLQKEWSDQLLDSIVEGIIVLDKDNLITFFSSGAERISGWNRQETLMQPCDTFFRPLETETLFSQLLPRLGGHATFDVEMSAGRQSSLAITSTAFNPALSSQTENLLVFRDVSEEQAMHRLMGHFMANISHEFRTPLSAIAASTELLIDQAGDLTSSELNELLSALHIGILKLSTLVDNLIESASIETGHFRVTSRPVDLGDILSEAVEMMQPLIHKHKQKLEIVLPIAVPKVQADPRRTIQVLTNLLSNASKFGPAGSTIRIVARLSDQMARIEIQDRGPGVAQEFRDYIFQRFASVSQGNTYTTYGVGLGLSVVKAIVEAEGGEVGISENPEGGAIFWFTLPEV